MGSNDKGKGRVAFSAALDDSSVNVVHIGTEADEEDTELEAPYNFVEVAASGAGPGEHVAESMGGARGPRRSILEEAELEQAENEERKRRRYFFSFPLRRRFGRRGKKREEDSPVAASEANDEEDTSDTGSTKEIEPEPYPEPAANIISNLFFSWVSPLILLGARRTIDHEDLWGLEEADKVDQLTEAFWVMYPKYNNSLLKALVAVVRVPLAKAALFMFIYTACQTSQPLLLRQLVSAIGQQEFSGLYYAIGLFCCTTLAVFANQRHLHYAFKCGTRLRALVISLVYRHSFTLNAAARMEVSNGQIITLLANDSQKFFDLMPLINLVWAAPLQICVATYFLISFLGTPALAGIATLVALVPVSIAMARIQRNLRKRHLPKTDARLQLLNEVLHGMRVVKYFCWEMPFMEKVMDLRNKEMKYVFWELMQWAGYVSVLIVFPVFAMMTTFAAYSQLEGPLNAADTFAALAFFNVLKFPLMYVGQVMTTAIQAWVALRRLAQYMQRESTETDKSAEGPELKTEVGEESAFELAPSRVGRDAGEPLVSLQNASFRWSKLPIGFVLRDIDLTVKRGELVAVVGVVGAGKSMLIQSLLRETNRIAGTVDLRGRVSYAAQEPFILNASVRENITFGRPFNETLYRKILDATSLWRDMQAWMDGDMTMIGERGVTLSGGQKARISVARAAYGQDDIVLLDDPLSALDAHTGRQVFESVFAEKGLLRNSARILVTHAVQYLARVDRIIVLADGEVKFSGTYAELQRAQDGAGGNDTLQEVLTTILEADQEEKAKEEEEEEGSDVTTADREGSRVLAKKSTKLMTDEERQTGSIGWNVYWDWVRASGGWPAALFIALSLALERFFYIGADYWIAIWTSAETGPPTDQIGKNFDLPAANSDEGRSYYIIGYVIWGFLNTIFAFARTFGFGISGARAAGKLFEQLLQSVMRSPMVFFETTPMGRVANRFSFDTEVIDSTLASQLSATVASTAWIISSVIVMGIVTPASLAAVIPVMIIFAFLQWYFRRCLLQLQRLDAISRSPIQAHFSESLNGATTIRAYEQSSRFIDINNELVDRNNRALIGFTVSQRWLGTRLELMGAFITGVVSMVAWASRSSISGGVAGMAVIWTFNLTTSFNFFVTFAVLSEAKMNSVERVSHYIHNLKPEPELTTRPDKRPPDTWPGRGKVEFKDVHMRYREGLPLALRGLTATIRPGERVGVVGRTGAGKSTIAVALFRLVELVGGQVLVDGVDLSELGLGDVRGRGICIIPQDPVLFSGTLRSNLDPFDEYSDADIWDSLKWVRMKDAVEALPDGLCYKVEEKGGNFSTGQRQLFCLARALLRRPRVLVLDEATASVDAVTDAFIQETVRVAFRESTILEIAHRLHSVMDADRVLVMSAGRVVEFDTAYNLLKNENGALSTLVESTGPAAAGKLRSLAYKKHQEGARPLLLPDHPDAAASPRSGPSTSGDPKGKLEDGQDSSATADGADVIDLDGEEDGPAGAYEV